MIAKSADLMQKVAWRLRFLVDPGTYAASKLRLHCDPDTPGYALLLSDARALGIPARLSFIASRTRRTAIDRWLLLRRRREAPDGAAYFDIGARQVFYRSARTGDDPTALEGVLTILKESCLRPPDFFSPEVFIRPGDVVFDVGGNIGTSALLFAEHTGTTGRIFSFEPLFHRVLSRTMEANHVETVRVVPRGVADRCGRAVFWLTPKGIDSRLAKHSSAARPVDADLVTLDAFVDQEKIDKVDFVKMDIEGAEELALAGARRVIERFRPRWSIASYHTDHKGEKQHPKLAGMLRQLGYRVRELEEKHIWAW